MSQPFNQSLRSVSCARDSFPKHLSTYYCAAVTLVTGLIWEEDHVFANSGYDDTLLWDIIEVQSGNLAAGLVGSVTAVIEPSANVTSAIVGGKTLFAFCVAAACTSVWGTSKTWPASFPLALCRHLSQTT